MTMNKRKFFGALAGLSATPVLAMVHPSTEEIVKQVVEKVPVGPPGPPGCDGIPGMMGKDGRDGRDWIETRFGKLGHG